MDFQIRDLTQQRFLGLSLEMSIANNLTAALWRQFSPRIGELEAKKNLNRYSIEVYPANYFDSFNPSTTFEKWAAVEVAPSEMPSSSIPEGMRSLVAPGGVYAVFVHKGTAAQGFQTYQKIFSEWLPASDFTVDHRPHFAIMGPSYRPDDPDAEEEILVPVKPKA